MAHIRDNFITCVLFKGTTKKILDRKDFKSDLFSNYKDAFRFLQQHLRFEYIIRDGGPRKEISEIPFEVLREGLVNAIVHRDYYEEGAGIDAFYRLGITEKIGSGIARMRGAMVERGVEITFDTEDFFIVTLARPETTQKEVTPQVTPPSFE